MSEWQKVKIGDLFNIEKGSLQSSKCTEGDFDFITASCDWKKHNEYTHETEALIVAVAASGSLGRVHYVNGKFISSDLCFILTPKNHDKYPLDFEFYFHILRSIREDLVKSTATGTSKLAINKGNFSNYKLPYFDIEHQKKFCKKLINLESNKEKLNQNSSFQQSHLTLLRQQILQDAISGKLTEDWRAENPDTEPASKLLEQIKVEKEKLIAEKKIKKEKPLSKIVESEIPFELPAGWEWCRLGEVSKLITDGEHQTPPRIQNGRLLLSAKNIRDGYIDFENVDYISEEHYQKSIKRCHPEIGNILIVSVGATIGRSAILKTNDEFAIVRSVALIKPLIVSNEYIKLLLDSNILQKDIAKRAWGTAQPCLYLKEITQLTIPLPPRTEQRAIVAKLSRLMGYVSQLEEKIAQNANNAETLMQAFLGEVFRK